MKINNDKLRKVQIVMDRVMIGLFGAGAIISFCADEHQAMSFFLLLVLAWLIILMKDCEIGHYIKIISLYKEVMNENDEILDKLIFYFKKVQKNYDNDNQ